MNLNFLIMNESVLHYVWQHKLFVRNDLLTTDGYPVEVIDPGKLNNHAGPDFFNAKIRIDGTLWVGNVEMHLRSSDWYRHNHQHDSAYRNVILHVVMEADARIILDTGYGLPQMELKFPEYIVQNYEELQQADVWISCERKIATVARLFLNEWKDSLLAERLELRVAEIKQMLKQYACDWEQVFFIQLCRGFGFSLNSSAFLSLAKSMSWNVVRKVRHDRFRLEALLLGQAGWLDCSAPDVDDYIARLRTEYAFLREKFGLKEMPAGQWKMLRLRPDNFPSVRIVQIAGLLTENEHLFPAFLETPELDAITDIFAKTKVSDYWKTHYVPGNESVEKIKNLGYAAIHGLIINVVVPLLFCYGDFRNDQDLKDAAVTMLVKLPAENNKITRNWKRLGAELDSALDSQAYIQLYKCYCEEKKCLRCRIGHQVLTKKSSDQNEIC